MSRRNMRTILLEPHPQTHAQLSALIAGVPRVVADNTAACPSRLDATNVTFYTLPFGNSSSTSSHGGSLRSQFASMSLDHVAKHAKAFRRSSRAIQALQVPCYSLPSILRRHGVADGEVRIVTVDAEGSDLDILEDAHCK